MNRRRSETTFSLIMLLTGAICALFAFSYPADSSGFPRAMSIILLALSSAELLRNYRLERRGQSAVDTDESEPVAEQRAQRKAALLVFLSAPLFIVFARLFDFEIAIYAYLLGGMLILGMRKPVQAVLISLFVLVVVKLLFFTLLDVSRAPALLLGS